MSIKRRQKLTEQVIIMLVTHSVAEETEVYPQIASRIDATEAGRLVEEQAEAEITMKALESLRPGAADFEDRFELLVAQIRAHVAEEEEIAFPRLRASFTHQELVAMGAAVNEVKLVSPTRPHPLAPDTPPGNLLLGPMTGLLDRLRDAVSGRGR
jgi:hemerythrin superfamily protein